MPRTLNTVLLVDDPGLVRALSGSFLNRADCRVATTAAGDAASLARREGADLVLLVAGAEPSEALQACRRIKSNAALRETLVVMIASEKDHQECLSAGADATLPDPPSREHLIETVRTFLPGFLRAAPRRGASVRVACFQGNEERLAYSKDLAEQGIFLKTRERFRVGDPVQMIFELPANERPTIRVEGEVVRRIEADRDSHLIPGIGVRFRRLSARDRRELARFVGEGS